MEQDYEEQQYPVQQPYPFMSHTNEGSLRYQLDVNEIIEDIEHTIKSEVLSYNPKTNQAEWILRKGTEPLINDKGLNAVMTILKSRLTKIFILSDFDKDDIEAISIAVGEDIIDDFYYNWNKYDIKDTAAASTILHIVTDTVFATLRKGYQGNYLKFLRTTHSIQEMQHNSISQRPVQQESSNNPLNFLFKKRR